MDLSHVAGKGGFASWEQKRVFAGAKLGSHGQVEWPGDIDRCPDALYLNVIRKRPEDG